MVLPSDADDPNPEDKLQFSLASDIVELLVLTHDEPFLQTLRQAVHGHTRLWHVSSAEKVGDLLVAGQVGIVVLDAGAMHEAPGAFVTATKRQFPDLVVVVAGHRDAENELAALISAGIVYRFIHKPMSPGRARLFAEAAVRRYGEQRSRAAPPARRSPRRHYWPLSAVAIAALALVTALAWTLRSAPRPSGSPDPRSVSTASGVKAATAQAALLARAAAALAAERLAAPPGDNALQLYLQASAQSPSDPAARAGLAEVRDRLIARAENALLEERPREAAAAIETARKSGAQGSRIALLNVKLARLNEQIASAHRVPTAKPDTTPAAAVDQVALLITLAHQRIDSGQLVEPERDSARYYVNAALSLDPDDGRALDAKMLLATRLLGATRTAIETHDFGKAEAGLQAAVGIASSSNIDMLRALLSAARQQAQVDDRTQLLKLAGERLHQDQLLEPPDDSAKYYLLALRAVAPDYPGLTQSVQDLGARLVAKAKVALALKQFDAARAWLNGAAAMGYTSSDRDEALRGLNAAAEQEKSLNEIYPSAQLTLLTSVPPVYPPRARENRIEGWIEVDFTVTENGQVTMASVHAASSPGVFDAAAMKSVESRRYQPIMRDGAAIAVRTRIRMRFAAP